MRLQGAKALRAGALTREDRFDNLHPVVVEMFHTLQDLLEVIKMCWLLTQLVLSSGLKTETVHLHVNFDVTDVGIQVFFVLFFFLFKYTYFRGK